MLELTPGVFAVDLALYIPADKALVLADLHLGYEEHLEKKGVFVPRIQYKDIIKRIKYILAQVEVKRVILNGDVKHEFGSIGRQEWREVIRLLDFFKKNSVEIIVIKGNHDTILGPIAERRNLKEVREYRTDGILVIHGDCVPGKIAETVLMGHEHPAVKLRENAKSEKFKCFLKGSFKGKTLIIQPSFNTLTTGWDITSEKTLSPLLEKVSDFEVFVVNDRTHQILPFGRVRGL